MLDALQGYLQFGHRMLTRGLKSCGNKPINYLDHGFALQYCRSIGVFNKNAFLHYLGMTSQETKIGSDHHNHSSCWESWKWTSKKFLQTNLFRNSVSSCLVPDIWSMQ